MKMLSWVIGNFYGKILGWSFFSKFHHALINLSLHALGYGNSYVESFSGETWFVKKILSRDKPNIIIDVGANVGNYSLILLKETEAQHIYAIEPNPAAYKELCKLPERVTKLNLAVSDYEGEALLHFRTDYDEKATLDKKNSFWEREVSVNVSTLDSLAKKYNIKEVDFIKIDTEGFEKEVLKGMGILRPKYIQFEFNINHLHRRVTLFEISELLTGYSFYRLLPNGWIKINPKKYLNNIFMFCNIIAVRND